MELRLIKINRHGEDNALVRISLEADYGWKEDMCKDVIQINYNGKKREAFITVKLLNPGVGKIADRIIEIVTGIDFTARSVKNPPLLILETLAEKLYLHYNDREAREALSGI
jgi:type III secretion system FlhB-like substrate exporter